MTKFSRVAAGVVVSFLLGVYPAHAQGYIAPSIGAIFENPSAQGRASFGAGLGWLSPRDPIGVELDIVYAPSFFGNDGPYGENSVTTVMGNVTFAPGSGGGYGYRGRRRSTALRPYFSVGVGTMHEVVTTPQRVGNTDLGVNAGIGVMALGRGPFGVRADVRYFRDLIDHQSGNRTDIDFGAFHYWRASIGVVLGL